MALLQLWTQVFPGSCISQASAAKRRSLLKLFGEKPDLGVRTETFLDRCITGTGNNEGQLDFTDRVRDCITCVRRNGGCPCGCYDQLLSMYEYKRDLATDAMLSNTYGFKQTM